METSPVTQADLLLIIGDQYVTISVLRAQVQSLTATARLQEITKAPANVLRMPNLGPAHEDPAAR